MPRKLRIEYAGAIYHLMNRGDRREPIFLGKGDRQVFLATLAEACQKTGWQVHACCLMKNHFHLVVETPPANLVAGMRWLADGRQCSPRCVSAQIMNRNIPLVISDPFFWWNANYER